MAPYLIATGNLSALTLLKAIPYLIIYNIIFVLPMVAVTFIVYYCVSSAEKVSEWRDRNIRRIHLIAGLVLVGLGIGMITGLI